MIFFFIWNIMTWNINENGYNVVQDTEKEKNIYHRTMTIHVLVNIREKKANKLQQN